MKELLIVIISSAVVSGVVSVIVASFFENRKYLKEKKFNIYSDFLDQLDQFIPPEVMGNLKGKELIKTVQVESAKIERHLWKLKLISEKRSIVEKAAKIVDLIGTFGDVMREIIKEDDDKKAEDKKKVLESLFQKIDAERGFLLSEMNKDINKFFQFSIFFNEQG